MNFNSDKWWLKRELNFYISYAGNFKSLSSETLFNNKFQIVNQVPGFWVVVGTVIYGEEHCQWLLGWMILHLKILWAITFLSSGSWILFINSIISYKSIFLLQVWLSRMDGHMGLANSLALKRAGITNSSEDPNGGTIMRTSTGGKILTSQISLMSAYSWLSSNLLASWILVTIIGL